jgi:recombination protein RecA
MPKTPKTEAASSGSAELDLALSAINKQFGEGAIMRIGEASKINIEVISTGSVAIDLALGVGGLPRGRIAEIYGPESSGKTTLCLSLIAQAQSTPLTPATPESSGWMWTTFSSPSRNAARTPSTSPRP